MLSLYLVIEMKKIIIWNIYYFSIFKIKIILHSNVFYFKNKISLTFNNTHDENI